MASQQFVRFGLAMITCAKVRKKGVEKVIEPLPVSSGVSFSFPITSNASCCRLKKVARSIV